MRACFVPPHYRKELLLKLQRLQQGPWSVYEYYKDLETTLNKIYLHENEESKIARFVSGLRREIQDVVDLYQYSSMEKLVQKLFLPILRKIPLPILDFLNPQPLHLSHPQKPQTKKMF